MTTTKSEFIKILNEHKGILYKITRSYCNDLDDRKDLEQEIVIQIWKSLKNYNPEFKLSTWIYRIGLNVAISHLRKDSTRKNKLEPFGESMFEIADEDGKDKIVSERTELLYKIINQLSPLNKALIMLYLEDKTHKEIAEIMGISESNVSTKLSRIKTDLRNNIKNQ